MKVGQNEEMIRFQEVSNLDEIEYNTKTKKAKKPHPIIIITIF